MDKGYKVQVEDLHKRFGDNEVLKGVNLDVKNNEVVYCSSYIIIVIYIFSLF